MSFDSFSLPAGLAWVEIPDTIGAQLWNAAIVKGEKQKDAEGAEICVYFAKAGAPKYIRRWRKANGKYAYAYASPVGAIGAHHFNNPEHFHAGASFAHGNGHYEVHDKDEHGNLTLTHSDDPTKQIKMHADQFAAHLKEHHAAAIDKHRSKLLADLGEAHLHGKGKQVERLSKEAAKHGYGLPEGAHSKVEAAAAKLKGEPAATKKEDDYDFSGGAPGPGKEAKVPEQKPATFPQSRIEHSLDSSNLERVSWDPEKPGSAKGTMKVHFKGGDAGEHPNVHHDDYMKVVNAHGSHGKAYNEHIKGLHDYVAKRTATPEDKKETSARGSETRAMNNDRQQKGAAEFMAQKEGKPVSKVEETAAKLKEAKPAEAKTEPAKPEPSKVEQAATKLKESAVLTPHRFEKLDPKKFDVNGNPRVPKGEAKAETAAPAKAPESAKQSEETSTAAYTDSGRPVPKWLAESNKIAAERHPDIQDALDGRLPPSGPLHDAMRGYLKAAQDSDAWHREQRKSGVDAGTMSHQGDNYFAKRKSLQEAGAKASAKLHETLTTMGAHTNDVEDVTRKLGANQSPAHWLPPKERAASKVEQAAAKIKEKAAATPKAAEKAPETAPAAKTPEPAPAKQPEPAKEAAPATTATPSASDILSHAKTTYGLNDKEHALVEKKAHDLGKHLAAGDTEKANAHVRQSVESVLAGMRNMSPSSARRHMKEAEAKAAPKAPKAEKKAKDEPAPAPKEAAKTEAPAKAEAPAKTDAQKKAEHYAEKARFQKEMDRRIKENMTKPDDGSDPFAGIEGADKPAPYGTSQRVSEAFPEAPKKEASKVEQAAEKIKAEAPKAEAKPHADVANESDRSKLREMSVSQSKIINDPSSSRDAVNSAREKWEAVQDRIEHLTKQEHEEQHKRDMAESEARQADYNAKYTARRDAIEAMGDPAFRRAMKFAHKTKTRWDKARPELQGVYVKDGVGYASDGHRAIAFPAKGAKDGFVHEHGPSDAGDPAHGAKLEKLMAIPEHGHESSHPVKDVREWTKTGAHVKLGSDKHNAPMVPSEQLKQAIEAAPGKVRIITNGTTQPVHIIRSDGERHIIMPVDPKTLNKAYTHDQIAAVDDWLAKLTS